MSLIAVTGFTLAGLGVWGADASSLAQADRAGFSCKHYNTTAGLGPQLVVDADSRRSGVPYLHTGVGASPSVMLGAVYRFKPEGTPLGLSTFTYVMGFAARLTGINRFGPLGFSSSLGAGSWGLPCAVWTTGDGKIIAGRGNSGGPSVTTSASAVFMPLDGVYRWYYIEIKYSITGGSSTATVEVKVDGTVRIPSQTFTTYGGTDYDPIGMGFFADPNSTTTAVCDAYMLDNTGSANNDYLGDCRVETLNPSGAGANQGWALGAGANHVAAVSESGNDASTGYLRAPGTGPKETFLMGDLASTVGAVKGVQVTNIVYKESSAARSVKSLVRIGSTDYQAPSGPTDPYSGDYRPLPGIFDINPATSAPWTASEINALEAGLVVVS